MGKEDKHLGFTGREAVTHFLGLLKDAAIESGEMFDQWARRRPYRLDPEDKLAEEKLAQRREFQKRTFYLKQKKFIKTKKIEGRLFYELTQDGRIELMKRVVTERPSLSHGEVCLVMYDVPTEGNLGRDAFRYFLKRIGFTQVQRSVWQTDKDAVKEVIGFVRDAKIEDWVEVYLAKKQ